MGGSNNTYTHNVDDKPTSNNAYFLHTQTH